MKKDLDALFEDTTAAPVADDSVLQKLSQLTTQLQELENEKQYYENKVAHIDNIITELTSKTIPELMQTYGVNKLSVDGVGEVSYSPKYRGSVSAENWPVVKQ